MRKNALAILALTLIAAISVSSATSIMSTDKGLPENDALLKTMQAGNATNATVETDDEQVALRNWNRFIENFDSQGEVLNGTITGNITYREAMSAITSILVLNSQELAETEMANPGEEYLDFHSYTVDAMRSFNAYLYNIAKYFETRDGRYAATAGTAFNLTVEYYNKGRDEVEFLF